ncbi:GTPase activating factor [Sporothrix epigloea]|uniref:GTPase activating factor n=1 Tax=Sporothrix epigloea TaxID=1892477 RepID=A0ABP0D535_9PEZI
MADWSEIFEQRLHTVLEGETGANGRAFPSSGKDYDFELTPPPTRYRIGTVLDSAAESDPTSAFFESIQKQNRPRSRCTGYALGGNNDGKVRDSLHYEAVSTHGMFTPAVQMARALSPVDDIDRPDMKELQECYSTRAQELHSEATKRMTEAGDKLKEELATMAAHEDAFLSMVAGKQSRFSQPVETWTVKVQTRNKQGGYGKNTDTERSDSIIKEERIVDRIEATSAAAASLQSDLKQLWAEWGQAHAEANEVLHAIASGGNERDVEFKQILATAETEMNAAAAEAIKEMNDNEKAFKKIILAEECKLAQMMLSRQSKYD